MSAPTKTDRSMRLSRRAAVDCSLWRTQAGGPLRNPGPRLDHHERTNAMQTKTWNVDVYLFEG